MDHRLVDIADVHKCLYKLLYETAFNNINLKVNADEIYTDIAENRLETWLNLVNCPGKEENEND